MSTDPPASEDGRLRHWITDLQVSPGNINPDFKFGARIFVDGELVCNLAWIDHTRALQWTGLLLCNVSPHSEIAVRLCRSTRDRPRYINYTPFAVSEVDKETGETILELPEAAWVVAVKSLTSTTASQLFSEEVEKFNAIEGVYNNLEPNETVKYLFKDALRFASLVAEALPECTAKVSFLIYMKAWEPLDQQAQLDDTVRAILQSLTRIGDIIDIANQASSSMLVTALNQSKASIDGILALLEDVSVYIFNRYATNDLALIPQDEEGTNVPFDVEAYLGQLEELQKAFYATWSRAADPSPDNADENIESSDTTDHGIQPMMVDESTRTDWYEVMNLLRPTNPSGYDPDQACMDGTREAVLNKVLTWTQNRDNGETFMWISGQVGMGKTAIATSLCQRLYDVHALGGSFFCQTDPSSSSPLTLINNLICQLAMNCPPYAREVVQAIRLNPMLCHAHLTLRYQGLVKKPLERLGHISIPTTFAIVVDGLDEFSDHCTRENLLKKLYEMSRLVPWLKVIIAGRPVGDIQEFFHDDHPHSIIVHLQDYDALPDIRAYIEWKVGDIAEKERWPSDSINRLCAMSQGVFLWAAVAIKYIKKSTILALPRLQTILNNQRSPVTDHFDASYMNTLKTTIDDTETGIKESYLRCIGAIIAISEREPITIPSLQYLLLVAARTDQPTLEQIITSLGPLILVFHGERIRFLHCSFEDFITSSSRSGVFHIRRDQYDAEPAACCLKIMQRDLRFNICNLETSHLPNREVPDLKTRIDTHIGPALKYACTHWIDHFMAAPSQALVEAIHVLFDGPQLMYWIEVLSLLGRMDVAIDGLSSLVALNLTRFNYWRLVVAWAKDAHRFLVSFHEAVTISTPHLYVSALAFSPHRSLTAQRMRPHFPNAVTFAQGRDLSWHPCVHSILHPHSVQSLSTSPDGLQMVTGYPDGSIAIWNNRTGSCINRSPTGHRDPVTCVTYSSKGDIVASSSHDSTIRVWDVAGGLQDSRVLTGHSGPVHSIAFSPNTSILASGSSDKTIRLWDAVTMRPIHGPYIGHFSRVSSLSFSPDGTKLVSGSWDKTIRVWSVDLGGLQLAANPLVVTGHSDSVTCAVFSPDGSKIVSGSLDRAIQIWDAETGTRSNAVPPKHSDTVTSVAFSPNGEYIASSSLDGAIQLWNITTTTTYYQAFGHFSPVNTLVVSPDGHVMSGSTDRTTRVWEPVTRLKLKTLAPLVGHSSYVLFVAVSSDGSRIVSGSRDNTVRIWDPQTGNQVGNPCTGHSSNVNGVAISPDGAHIVSGSDDKTMKLWNTTTHANVHSYEHSHPITCTAFSPNGRFIAFGSNDDKVYVWDFTGWKMIKQGLQGHSNNVLGVAFSPDGACIASASADCTVILWDVGTHSRSNVTLSGHADYVRSVAFSPCGTRLVSGSDDNTVRVWDRQTGSTIHTLTGHTHWVMSVAFSPDGAYIASGSRDGTVRLWNANTGQAIGQPFTGHTDWVRSIAFSPDMSYLISGADDRTIRVWGLEALHPLAEQTQDPPGAFCWPSNPYDLSSHPDRPGWVTHDRQSLVLWLPAHYQQPEQFISQVGRRKAFLDYSKFVHGTSWTGVASDAIRRNSG